MVLLDLREIAKKGKNIALWAVAVLVEVDGLGTEAVL